MENTMLHDILNVTGTPDNIKLKLEMAEKYPYKRYTIAKGTDPEGHNYTITLFKNPPHVWSEDKHYSIEADFNCDNESIYCFSKLEDPKTTKLINGHQENDNIDLLEKWKNMEIENNNQRRNNIFNDFVNYCKDHNIAWSKFEDEWKVVCQARRVLDENKKQIMIFPCHNSDELGNIMNILKLNGLSNLYYHGHCDDGYIIDNGMSYEYITSDDAKKSFATHNIVACPVCGEILTKNEIIPEENVQKMDTENPNFFFELQKTDVDFTKPVYHCKKCPAIVAMNKIVNDYTAVNDF